MRKSKIVAGILTVFLSAGVVTAPIGTAPVISVSAETSKETSQTKSDVKNGWYTAKSNGKKMYYLDGEKIISKTKKIDGKIYLFDSDGYLVTDGIHTVNGNKYYSNKDGTVKCNKWVSHKYTKSGNTYYYATSTGKIIVYQFKKNGSNYCLYVNGRLSKADDIPLNNVYNFGKSFDTSGYNDLMRETLSKNIESRCGYFKVGSHIYHLNYSYTDECVVCDMSGKTVYESYNCDKNKFYDLGSGKELGHFLGFAQFNQLGYVSDGLFVNAKERSDYVILNGECEKSKLTYPLIITDRSEKLNSVGGLNYNLTVVNNSGKTINYIYYNVHVVNRVGDTVNDTISYKKSFRLKDTGPYAAGDVSNGVWKAIIYNYSANKVIIDSIEIKYKDGTSITVKGSDILDIPALLE